MVDMKGWQSIHRKLPEKKGIYVTLDIDENGERNLLNGKFYPNSNNMGVAYFNGADFVNYYAGEEYIANNTFKYWYKLPFPS